MGLTLATSGALICAGAPRPKRAREIHLKQEGGQSHQGLVGHDGVGRHEVRDDEGGNVDGARGAGLNGQHADREQQCRPHVLARLRQE